MCLVLFFLIYIRLKMLPNSLYPFLNYDACKVLPWTVLKVASAQFSEELLLFYSN